MLLSIAILLIIWGAYLIGKKYKDSFLISYDRRKRGLIIIASSVFLLSFFVFVKNDGLFLVVLFSILLIGLGIYYLYMIVNEILREKRELNLTGR